MFKKVLIAEDADYIPNGIKEALKNLQITNIAYAQYCDEAFLKIQKAILDEAPYDLLISDLSFVGNPNEQKIVSGEALITKVKELQPNIKIIVFSIEDKAHTVQKLYNTLNVNGYVLKNVNGQKELKTAVKNVFNGARYISIPLKSVLNSKEAFEITEYDIFLLKCLSRGIEQKDIPAELKAYDISPYSISSVEKRLKLLKVNFNANNPTQLVAITKDFGLI